MQAWDTWLNDLMPHLPGCGADLVAHELKRAAQDFFERSRAWGVLLDEVSVAIDESEVEILPDDTRQSIVRIESASWNGEPLEEKTLPVIEVDIGADWMDQTGTPTVITQLAHNSVRLVVTPDAAGVLRCRVSVKPSDASLGLPDQLAYKYREILANGAKARLMLMPKKPWSNDNLGALASSRFEDSLGTAKSSAFRAFGSARTPSRPSWC